MRKKVLELEIKALEEAVKGWRDRALREADRARISTERAARAEGVVEALTEMLKSRESAGELIESIGEMVKSLFVPANTPVTEIPMGEESGEVQVYRPPWDEEEGGVFIGTPDFAMPDLVEEESNG